MWCEAIAQWIRLRPPTCRLGSSPKNTTIYAFINLLNCVMWKRRNKQKEAWISPIFKKKYLYV